MSWFDCGLTFSHFYLLTSNLLPNFLIAVTHSVFNIMSSVIALNQIDGSELWKKVGFKHSEKVLVALRGVYNLPFNLDDPVYTDFKSTRLYQIHSFLKPSRVMHLSIYYYNIYLHYDQLFLFLFSENHHHCPGHVVKGKGR